MTRSWRSARNTRARGRNCFWNPKKRKRSAISRVGHACAPRLSAVIKSFATAIICFGSICRVTAQAQENLPSNWDSPDAPCAQYDNLRNRVLGNIGVKIDVNRAWAKAFRRALKFWNSVLLVNFHEERSLNACSIRIVSGSPEILNNAILARSQLIGRVNFRGKIAVSPRSEAPVSF